MSKRGKERGGPRMVDTGQRMGGSNAGCGAHCSSKRNSCAFLGRLSNSVAPVTADELCDVVAELEELEKAKFVVAKPNPDDILMSKMEGFCPGDLKCVRCVAGRVSSVRGEVNPPTVVFPIFAREFALLPCAV